MNPEGPSRYVDDGALRTCFLQGDDLPREVVAPVLAELRTQQGTRPPGLASFVRRILFSPALPLSQTVELLSTLHGRKNARLASLDAVLTEELRSYSGRWTADEATNGMIAQAIRATGRTDSRHLAWISARGILKAFRAASHFDESLALVERESLLLWAMAHRKTMADARLRHAVRPDFWCHPGIRYVYAGALCPYDVAPRRRPARPRFLLTHDFDKVLR